MDIRRLFAMLAALVATICSGCIYVGVGTTHVVDSRPDVIVVEPAYALPVLPEDAAAFAEIDAAADMDFDSSRGDCLERVAVRPELSPAAQVHLAQRTLTCMEFDSGKVDVLLALIANPRFCEPAKLCILRNLHLLDFDSNRREVMDALDARGPAVQVIVHDHAAPPPVSE